MKKKLIAAILSVAMVASMVPATAFAATEGAAKAKTSASQTKADAVAITTVKEASEVKNAAGTGTLSSLLKITTKANATPNLFDLVFTGKAPYETSKNRVSITVTPSTNSEYKSWTITPYASGAAGIEANTTIAKEAKTFDLEIGTTDKIGYVVNYYKGDASTDSHTKTPSVVVDKTETFEFTAVADNLSTASEQLVTDFVVAMDKLPDNANYVTAKNKDDIVAARTAYDLVVRDGDAAGQAHKLLQDMNGGPALVKLLEDCEAALRTNKVNDAIIAIGKIPAKVPAVCAELATAKTAVDAVAYQDQSKITNINDYNNATVANKVALAIEGQALLKTIKVEVAQNKIDTTTAINAVKVTDGDYDKATSTQLARVANLDLLTKAQKAIDAYDANVLALKDLKAKMDTVAKDGITTDAQLIKAKDLQAQIKKDTTDIPANTISEATAYGTSKVAFDKAITDAEISIPVTAAANAVIAQIEAVPKASVITLEDMAKLEAAQYAYDNLGTDAKALVTKSGCTVLLDQSRTAIEGKIKTATKADFTATFVKVFIDAIPDTLTAKDVDTVKVAAAAAKNAKYATYLDKTLSVWPSAAAKLAKAEAEADVIIASDKVAAEKFVKSVKEIVNGSATFKSDVKAARAIYDALTDSQKKYTDSTINVAATYAQLLTHEATVKAADDATTDSAAAAEIITAIKALPRSVKEIKVTDKDALNAVNKKYTDATKEVKALVNAAFSNGTLKDASDIDISTTTENAETYLKAAVEKIGGLAVADVIAQIKTLPTVKTDATKAEIDAAKAAITPVRKAYDDLTADQKKEVTNAATLTAAEVALSTATVNYVNTQLDAIVKLDLDKDLTEDGAKLIKETKVYVDALTDAEKAKLNVENYKTYTDKALKALEAYEKGSNSLATAKIEGLKNTTYTAKAQKPAITVVDKNGKAIAAENYKVVYSDNKDVGQATVTVVATSTGAYTGSTEANFIITPAKDTVTSLQVAKAVLRVNMKAMPGANHQIYYKLTSGDTYSRVNTSANTKRLTSANGIKAKKKYTVKVRAYKSVDGKTYYGSFSSLKRMVTK